MIKNQLITVVTVKGPEMKNRKRNRKNWTDTDITKLRRMYRSGRLTLSQIAESLERTYFATAKQASCLGLTYGKKPVKNWSS